MNLPGSQKSIDSGEPIQDPNWVRSSSGYFHRLTKIDTHPLHGQSGIIVIWHAGATPQWVYIEHTDDLASAFKKTMNDKAIMDLENEGGLYASWSFIREEYQPGIVRYMIETLKPLINNNSKSDSSIDPIPVFAPGARGPAL